MGRTLIAAVQQAGAVLAAAGLEVERLTYHTSLLLPAVEMLRDKRGVGGKVLGLGNRNAIDALIATHSVVVDATHMIMWVGLGPHALGEYVAFDLRHELLDEPRRATSDFLADPTLKSNEYRDFVLAGKELEVSQILEKRGEKDRAVEEAARAVELAPLLPEARKLALKIASRAPRAVEKTKRALHAARQRPSTQSRPAPQSVANWHTEEAPRQRPARQRSPLAQLASVVATPQRHLRHVAALARDGGGNAELMFYCNAWVALLFALPSLRRCWPAPSWSCARGSP